MSASRASADRPLPPCTAPFSLGAMWFRQSWLARDARWFAGLAAIYALAVSAAALTLNRYFSRTWDVTTFAAAARSLLNGSNWPALYAQTRIARQWPFAYPPLHAVVIAPLLALGTAIPDWLLVRVPPLLADLGVGALVYTLVARRTQEAVLARLALAIWLLNPVTFYDTAVQGHFESEWLLFVVLAYLLAEARRGIVWPTLALACAFLFKQVAILFVLPYWLSLFIHSRESNWVKRIAPVAASGLLFALPVLLVSLPFLLYSGDYLYMNMQYVAEVPLQTQSWLVAFAGLFGPNFFLLQHSTVLVSLLAAIISFFAIRRGLSLWLTAVLIALAFFLWSQKVMGYYYVMLLPFALVEFIAARRLGLLTLIVSATAWIALSPYLASWVNPYHLPVYAALGTLNSLLWLGVFIYLWRNHSQPLVAEEGNRRTLVFVSAALFFEAVAAALVQPLINNSTSPIRAPMIPAGLESNVFLALIVFGLLVLAALYSIVVLTRSWIPTAALPRGAFALVIVLAPLFFLTFALTKESTAFLETILKSFGL